MLHVTLNQVHKTFEFVQTGQTCAVVVVETAQPKFTWKFFLVICPEQFEFE